MPRGRLDFPELHSHARAVSSWPHVAHRGGNLVHSLQAQSGGRFQREAVHSYPELVQILSKQKTGSRTRVPLLHSLAPTWQPGVWAPQTLG